MSVNFGPESMRTLEGIKRQLKQQKDLEGNQVKSDLYSHLTEVFSRILQYHPYDAYDKFEEISNLVKQTNLKFVDPKFDYELNAKKRDLSREEAEAFIKKIQNLIKEIPDVGVTPADRKLLTKDQAFQIPDLQEQAMMLEWAGIDFGEDNIFYLQKSLKRLAVLSGATKLKFFGKILGTQKDYWVVSGTLNIQEEEPNPTQEKRGVGANATVFWVTDSLLNDWI